MLDPQLMGTLRLMRLCCAGGGVYSMQECLDHDGGLYDNVTALVNLGFITRGENGGSSRNTIRMTDAGRAYNTW